MLVVGLPIIQRTFDAAAFEAHLAKALVPAENCHPLLVREESLVVFQLHSRIRFKEAPQEVVVLSSLSVLWLVFS
jgi:hypothetical protein